MKQPRTFLFLQLLAAAASLAQTGDIIRPANSAEDLFAISKEAKEVANRGKLPEVTRQFHPVYPFEMRASGLQGEVLIAFVIDTQGDVREAHVVRSNNIWFERPALDAVMKWKFKPGLIDGRPVNTRMQVPILFRLEGGGGDMWKIDKKQHEKLPEYLRWDQAPRVIGTAYPVYPRATLVAGIGGKVQLVMIVNPKGLVGDVAFRGEVREDFQRAVRAALDHWRFMPARKNDQPSPAALTMEFDFRPGGQGQAPVPESAFAILRRLKKPAAQFAQADELDRPLKVMSQRPPAYPPALQKAGTTGRAIIEFFVDEKGDAQLPEIVSSTHPEFGYAAAQCVASWRFRPPIKGGKPVVVQVKVPVEFNLE